MKKLTMPWIIGIIVIIIALLTVVAKAKGGIALGVAGLVLLFAPKKHSKKMFDLFVGSFSRVKTIIITALYDAVYWLLVFGAVYFFNWRLSVRTTTLPDISRQTLMNPALTGQSVTGIKSLVTFLYGGMTIVLLFCFVLYVLSRGLIWTTIAKQKPSKKFFKKFFGLNAIWWLIWIIPFLVFTTVAGDQAAGIFVLLFLFASYFTVIIHTLYTRRLEIGSSLGNGLGWGISKLHRLLVPYTYAFIVYVILYQGFRLAQGTSLLTPVSMLFVVLYLAWLRAYLYTVLAQFR